MYANHCKTRFWLLIVVIWLIVACDYNQKPSKVLFPESDSSVKIESENEIQNSAMNSFHQIDSCSLPIEIAAMIKTDNIDYEIYLDSMIYHAGKEYIPEVLEIIAECPGLPEKEYFGMVVYSVVESIGLPLSMYGPSTMSYYNGEKHMMN